MSKAWKYHMQHSFQFGVFTRVPNKDLFVLVTKSAAGMILPRYVKHTNTHKAQLIAAQKRLQRENKGKKKTISDHLPIFRHHSRSRRF